MKLPTFSFLLASAVAAYARSAVAAPIELGAPIDVGAHLRTDVSAPAEADEERNDFAIATHGSATLVAWVEDGLDLRASVVAADGTATTPTTIYTGSAHLYSVRATFANGQYRVAVGDRQGIFGAMTVVSLDEAGAVTGQASYGPPAESSIECTPGSMDARGASLVVACAGYATVTLPAAGTGSFASLLLPVGSPATEVSCLGERCVAGFAELDAAQQKNIALVTLGETSADLPRTYLGFRDATSARIAVALTRAGAVAVSRSRFLPSGDGAGEAVDHIDGYLARSDGTVETRPSLIESSGPTLLDARIATNGTSVALTYRTGGGASSIVALETTGASRGETAEIASAASKDVRLAAAAGGHYVVAYDDGASLYVRTVRLDDDVAPDEPAAPNEPTVPERPAPGESDDADADDVGVAESGCSAAGSPSHAPAWLAALGAVVALAGLRRRR